MDNFIKNLEIKNFKSIKHLTLDCKRVNVFIGKPNVGKSNILEAMGLFSYPLENNNFFGKDVMRLESVFNLFYDEDVNLPLEVSKDNQQVEINQLSAEEFEILVLDKQWLDKRIEFEHKIVVERNENYRQQMAEGLNDFYHQSPIRYVVSETGNIVSKIFNIEEKEVQNYFNCPKKYTFKALNKYDSKFQDFLFPPSGSNLFTIIDKSTDLKNRIAALANEQLLDFVLDRRNSKFEFQKRVNEYVYKYPYSSIADTFQRFIFYLAAIESNKDSVLIFEEPEVHSFPPYVKELAERIAYKKENQFFISTHSPYLLNTLISRLDSSELTVFLTYYKDYQTFVKPLSEESIQEVRDLGVDVFFNLDRF